MGAAARAHIDMDIPTARVFSPLLQPSRYKGAYGGRGSGKSQFFAGHGVYRCAIARGLRMVCIREHQASLKESAKKLIENKIQQFGVGHLFRVLNNEIRTPGGGIIAFQGMQDHTAESIKSLEDFDIAWVEEAQTLSAKSNEMLRPTIRAANSELWYSWNRRRNTDAVDTMFLGGQAPTGSIVVRANWSDNPWFPEVLEQERLDCLAHNPDQYDHIWEGGYLQNSHALVLSGKVRVAEFDPYETIDGKRRVKPGWEGPYYGADWGFAQDPTAAVKCWVHENTLYVEYDAGQVGLELDHTADFLKNHIPGIDQHTLRSDSARPETISYLRRFGLPRIEAVKKWAGSVEDGISHLRSYREIVIHSRCRPTIQEAGLYSYKIDRASGDILPVIVDANNHYMDALRYALNPMIQQRNHSVTGANVDGL